jgi:hypothetical protein
MFMCGGHTVGNANRVLVEKPEGKRSLGRHRRRCENKIKMHFKEQNGRAWTVLIQLIIGTSGGLETSSSVFLLYVYVWLP